MTVFSAARRVLLPYSLAGSLVLLTLSGVSSWAASGAGSAGSGGDQAGETGTFMFPGAAVAPHVEAAADSIRIWGAATAPRAADRPALYAAIGSLLRQYGRFADRMATIYPKNRVEWLLATDDAADTLTQVVHPLLGRYVDANPNEILSDGRQKLELALMKITGPPSAMLGFHVVKLANYAYVHADSLLAGQTSDVAGVQEGVLRSMADWCQLWAQVHSDPIAVYNARLNQEDWIITRLVDDCGNVGGSTWQLASQFMAVQVDTLVSPARQTYAHELQLKATRCEQDTLTIYIDLPNFEQMQDAVLKKMNEGKSDQSEAPPGR